MPDLLSKEMVQEDLSKKMQMLPRRSAGTGCTPSTNAPRLYQTFNFYSVTYLSLRVIEVGWYSDDSIFCFGSQVIFCNTEDHWMMQRLNRGLRNSALELLRLIPAVSFIFMRTKAPA